MFEKMSLLVKYLPAWKFGCVSEEYKNVPYNSKHHHHYHCHETFCMQSTFWNKKGGNIIRKREQNERTIKCFSSAFLGI